jgi:ribonuclease HI
LIEGSAGFAIHRTGVGGFGFKLSSPAGVFSAELSALFMAMRHIREIIEPPEKCLILTDSLSSIKAMLLCCPEELRGELIRSYMNASNCALSLYERFD